MTTLPNLTLTDPLAKETVRIVITVSPQAVPRPEKAILLSLSATDQPPIMETGTLGQIPDLIQKAWIGFGVRQQTPVTPTEELPTGEAEVVAEMTVTNETQDPPAQPTPPAIPKPQPKNLSLF